MKNTIYTVSIICIGVFSLFTVIELCNETKDLYKKCEWFAVISEHEKKVHLLGDEYVFAWLCKQIIPDNANALFITNSSSSHGSSPVFISYEVYPIKLYFLNTPDPYPDIPPSVNEIDRAFLKRYNIDWIIFRYTDPLDKNLVIRLRNGQEFKRYSLNVPEKTHHVVP